MKDGGIAVVIGNAVLVVVVGGSGGGEGGEGGFGQNAKNRHFTNISKLVKFFFYKLGRNSHTCFAHLENVNKCLVLHRVPFTTSSFTTSTRPQPVIFLSQRNTSDLQRVLLIMSALSEI